MLLETGRLLLLAVALFGVQIYLRRQKAGAETNRSTTLAAYLMVMLLTAPLLLAKNTSQGTPLPQLPAPPALTVEQLLGPVEGRQSQPKLLLWGSSPILTVINAYDQSYIGEMMEPDPAQPQLFYDQMDIHWMPVYGACLRHTLQSFDWAKEDHPGIAFESRPAPAGMDALYVLNQPIHDNYPCILCWEGRIVTLYPSWPLTEAQMAQAGAALAPQPAV